MRKHWAILGAGSIGCLWAAKLCQAGITPTLILRPARYKQCVQTRVSSISMIGIDNNLSDYNVNIASPQTIREPVDTLVICTKAQHSESAVISVKHALHSGSIILLLQNGMGSQQAIASSLPSQAVWAGSVTDGAYLKAPFVVCHAGKGKTLVGKLSGPKLFAEIPFIDTLKKLPLDIQITSDIEQTLWDKLAINCCINGLTALYNCKNGELLDNDYKQQHLHRLIVETQYTLQQLGRTKKNALMEQVETTCKLTAHNISSTCNDVRAGRATELACINSFLIKAASAKSIKLKEHTQLLSDLRQQGVKI